MNVFGTTPSRRPPCITAATLKSWLSWRTGRPTAISTGSPAVSRSSRASAACARAVPVAAAATADEGMWTYNKFPKEALKQAHGVTVDDAWLDHLRLSSARLAQGCSASFVSADGLVMTNHHCAHACIEQL